MSMSEWVSMSGWVTVVVVSLVLVPVHQKPAQSRQAGLWRVFLLQVD